MKVLLVLSAVCLIASYSYGYNTAKYVQWGIYNVEGNTTDACSTLDVNSCQYCNGYYYRPDICYGFDECYFNVYFDDQCEVLSTSYQYAYESLCDNTRNYTQCSLFWYPPQLSQCTSGCNAPVMTVKSDVGVSAYHFGEADGPNYITQSSANQVSVAGRLKGVHYADGYGNRVFFEGFLSEDSYLTTAGYCTVGQWCNSTTTMQYKLDIEDVTVPESTLLGFDLYNSAAIVSSNYDETPVNVVIPTGSSISFLEVDSDWDLTNIQIKANFALGSLSGIFPIILHQNSISYTREVLYTDMLFVLRASYDGVLAYNFEARSFEIYQRGYCEGEGYSSSIPVCTLGVSFDDAFAMDKKWRSTDEMAFTLL